MLDVYEGSGLAGGREGSLKPKKALTKAKTGSKKKDEVETKEPLPWKLGKPEWYGLHKTVY
jgi:hypothetical protein